MDDVVQMLKDAGAILEGHFVGTSGRHMSLYITKDAWFPHTELVSKVCAMLAELNKDKNIEIVVGPAVGGVVLSTWTAYHLSRITGKEVLSLFTEKTSENGQVFKRGYDKMVKGKRVLLVEDTVATGSSIRKVVDTIQAAGGDLVQISLVINRVSKDVNAESFGVPVNALGEVPADTYAEDEVPDWLKKIPINTTVGHGAAYIKEHPQH
ncbi:orotate phosphoribosyltransferase [Candidatus Kaiserbacteria bacterium]|nr:orotate phosphoribosyltransferase [Candidatus Kaiserbacteria bacterium]